MTVNFNCNATQLAALNNMKAYITNTAKTSIPVGQPSDYGKEELFLNSDETLAAFQTRMGSNTALRDTYNAQFGSTDDLFNFFDADGNGTLSADEAAAFNNLAASPNGKSYDDVVALTKSISEYTPADASGATASGTTANQIGLTPTAQIDLIESLGEKNIDIADTDYTIADDGSFVFTTTNGSKVSLSQNADGEYVTHLTYSDHSTSEITYNADKTLKSELYKDGDTEEFTVFGTINDEPNKKLQIFQYDPKDSNPDKDAIAFYNYNEQTGEMERMY